MISQCGESLTVSAQCGRRALTAAVWKAVRAGLAERKEVIHLVA
jgi:hypothetical protein